MFGKTDAAVIVAIMVGAAQAKANNLIQNGGFETGDFSEWIVAGHGGTEVNGTGLYVEPSNYIGAQGEIYGAHSGDYYCYFGPVGGDSTISQSVTDAMGASYQISYWVAGDGTGPSNLEVYWDGSLVSGISNTIPNQPYTEYMVDVPGTGTDVLEFGMRNDPAADALDDIALIPVPEPVSAGILLPIAWAILSARPRQLIRVEVSRSGIAS